MTRNRHAPRCTKASGHSFANVITGWTVSVTDQNTTYCNNDLQVGKASGAASLAFSVTHKMGIVKMTMGTATVVNTITYDGNTSTEKYRSSTTTSTTSLAVFDNFNPLTSSATYYLIVKPSTAYTLNSGYKVTTTSGNPVYQWSQSVTNSAITSGKCKAYTPTPSFRNFARLYSYVHDADNTDEATRPDMDYQHYGAIQTFQSPVSSKIKLEVWGAAGARGHVTSVKKGRGGYSKGTYNYNSGTLYICVGGMGVGTGSSINIFLTCGGYNGGGGGQTGGGGATHIAIEKVGTGVLSEYSSSANQAKVLVVAGGGGGWDGGGGQANTNKAGDGGGVKGTSGWSNYSGTAVVGGEWGGAGGTQSAGGVSAIGTYTWGSYSINTSGSFGKGGDSRITTTYPTFNADTGAGGGGGWYGGAASAMGSNYCGGGGSGYVNTSKLINGTYQTIIGGDSDGDEGSAAVDKTDIPDYSTDNGTLIVGNYDCGKARLTVIPYD